MDELWQKHPKDLMSMWMWVMDNQIQFSIMLSMPQWIWTCQAKMIPHSHLVSKPLGK
jgi:hypothetical protein